LNAPDDPKHCLACGGENVHFYARANDIVLLRCRDCKLVFQESYPGFEESQSDYLTAVEEGERILEPDEALETFPDFVRRSSDMVYTIIRKHAPRGSVLDVGCWMGCLLLLAKRDGREVAGIEPAPAGDFGRVRCGLEVQRAFVEDADFGGTLFDVVVSTQTIEHTPDPYSFLHAMGEFAKPGGIVVVTLPNARNLQSLGKNFLSRIGVKSNPWKHLGLPKHMSQFGMKSIRLLGQRCGLEPVASGYLPSVFIRSRALLALRTALASWIPTSNLYVVLRRPS
jgi:SAM-dependent methyltransferase